MPPRQASRCCRVVQRRVSAPIDSVWISDSLLSHAFERCCYVSRATRRNSSGAPGPLESRRRLGKRHMTELNSLQTHPALPAWALPNPVDLSHWRWFPPRGSGLSNDQFERVEWPPWLSRWFPENSVNEGQTPDVLRDAAVTVLETKEKELHFLAQVEAFAASPPVSQRGSAPQFRHLCQQFEQQLALGELSSEDASRALVLLNDALDSCSFSSAGAVHRLRLSLYSIVVRGIKSCRVLSPSDFGPTVWTFLFAQLGRLPPSDQVSHVFVDATAAVPATIHGEIMEPLLAVLDHFSISWAAEDEWDPARRNAIENATKSLTKASRHIWLAKGALRARNIRFLRSRDSQDIRKAAIHRAEAYAAHHECQKAVNLASNPARMRQIHAVTKALDNLGVHQDKTILQKVIQLALGRTAADQRLTNQVRYSWLSVLARLSNVEQDMLFSVAASVQGNQTPRSEADLSDRQMCELLLMHWQSRGDAIALNNILLYFERCSRNIEGWSFAALLATISKHQQLTDSHPSLCKSMWTFVRKLGRQRSVLKSLLAYGNVRTLPRSLRQEMVAYLAHHFAHDPQLSERMAFRLVSQCVDYLVAHRCHVTAPVLVALFRVLTRDLSSGKPGRTQRLRWALSVLYHNYGFIKAQAAREELRLWRRQVIGYLVRKEAFSRDELLTTARDAAIHKKRR